MIKLSKKWWYAIKATLFISDSEWLVKISDISESQSIPESLLRRVISDLEKSGIVITIKWRSWWVKLGMEKHHISLYDILNSVWEELWITDCTKWVLCKNEDHCRTTNVFSNLQKSFNGILKLHTLDKM